RYASIDVAVLGDSRATAKRMAEMFVSAELSPASFRDALAARRETLSSERAQVGGDGQRLSMDLLLKRLESRLPNDRVLVLDAGRFFTEPVKWLSVPDPRDYIHTQHIASIGLGMGYAVGAAIGAP